MKAYYLPTLFFRKKWIWFQDPHDVSDATMVTFFSYNNCSVGGFSKSVGLTSVIDLTRPIEEIWIAMRSKFIREQIGRGERRGIVVSASDDFPSFYPIYLDFRKRRKLATERFETLRKNGTLFLASVEGKVIAGGVFIGDGEHMRALVLASTRLENVSGRARDIIGEANRMVMWAAIKYAKTERYKRFDLGGIDPESTDSGARSLAEFKEAFGGVRVAQYYYTKVYSRLLRVWMWLRTFLR